MLLAAAVLVMRAAALARGAGLAVEAAIDCGLCLGIAALSGGFGLGAAAFLVLLGLQGSAGLGRGEAVVLGMLTLAGLFASRLAGAGGAIEPYQADLLGVLVALVRSAEIVLRSPKAMAPDTLASLAALGHELRTPLNVIIGYAGLMRILPADAGAERAGAYARIIETSGEHLLAVLEAAGAGGPRSEGQALAPDACGTLAAVAEALRPKAAARGITVRLPALLPDASPSADRRALTQVLMNLLGNAIKFSPTGSQVTIGVSQEPHGLALRIHDDGIGVAAETLARLGRPYLRAPEAQAQGVEGMGLGLAISKRIAEQQGWRLVLESAPGAGTTAVLTLPYARRSIRVFRDAA